MVCGTNEAMRPQSPSKRRAERRELRPPKPLDSARLNDLALAYVARFATSAGKLADYLKRKLRERGWDGEHQPDVAAIVAKFVAAGYIDDTAYARAKSGGLLRRGYGGRRIDQALSAAGIADEVREEVRAPLLEQRAAALALARKRRFGPFGDNAGDRVLREKQLAAMLRAGHPLDSARFLVNAASVEAAEDWAVAGDDL